jgi:hypothetical protein
MSHVPLHKINNIQLNWQIYEQVEKKIFTTISSISQWQLFLGYLHMLHFFPQIYNNLPLSEYPCK